MTNARKLIMSFIKDSLAELTSEADGIMYLRLDYFTGLAVVAAYDEEEQCVRCKLAYNCDDLQSDFDFDWMMPTVKESGDVYDTEITLSDPVKDSQWFVSNYTFLKKLLKTHKLEDFE